MVGSIVVQSKKYGNVITYPERVFNFKNLFLAEGKKDGKTLRGIIDKDGNEIIDLEERELAYVFFTENKNNICFGFKHTDSDLINYYHLQKTVDNKYKVAMEIDPDKQTQIDIIEIPGCNDYWLFEANNRTKEKALYQIEERRLITNFFDHLELIDEKESKDHRIYFEKDIYVKLDNSESTCTMLATTLCGFMDKNGYFSSQIIDTGAINNRVIEKYDSIQFGITSLSDKFHSKIQELKDNYIAKYNEHEAKVDEAVSELFYGSNPNIKDSKKAKIIEFRPRKKV